MDEDVKVQIGAGLPEWSHLFGIERQILQFRGDHGARESELDDAALQFGGGLRRLERRHMRQADKAAVMRQLRFTQAIVDQAADLDVRLIETCAAGEHAGIDAAYV